MVVECNVISLTNSTTTTVHDPGTEQMCLGLPPLKLAGTDSYPDHRKILFLRLHLSSLPQQKAPGSQQYVPQWSCRLENNG